VLLATVGSVIVYALDGVASMVLYVASSVVAAITVCMAVAKDPVTSSLERGVVVPIPTFCACADSTKSIEKHRVLNNLFFIIHFLGVQM
jgi:hypothetical protein